MTAAGEEGRWRWAPLLVAALAALVFLNTLACGFTLDDLWLVLDNPRIGDPSYVRYLLFERTLWRPAKRLSLMADWALWGPDPRGFHLTNVVLHALACLALHGLFRRLTGSPRVSLVAALLFAVHPVHVEAVANVCHRKEPMSLLFGALSLSLYLDARNGRARGRAGTALLLLLSLVSFLLAMLSKEVAAVMVPALVLTYEVALAPRGEGRVARRIALFALPFVPVLALFTAYGYLGTIGRRFRPSEVLWITQGVTDSYSRLLLGAIQAFGQYAGLLVWPHPLYFDRAFTLPGSAASFGVVAGLHVALAFVVALGWSWRRSRLGFFALAWYGLTLLPVLNLVPLTFWLIAERFLYVPSAGIALAAGLALEPLWRGRARRAAAAALAIVLLVHAALTVRQNRVWTDSLTLWGKTLRHNPRSLRGLYGYGFGLEQAGQIERAEELYRKTIAQEPAERGMIYPEPYLALARIMLRTGRDAQAIPLAERYAGVKPRDAAPHIAIGNALVHLERYPEAVAAYERAVGLRPEDPVAVFLLANGLFFAGRHAEAVAAAERSAAMRPDMRARVLRGNALEKQGQDEEALRSYRRASEVAPAATRPLNDAARLLRRLGRRVEAEEAIRRSLAIDPAQPGLEEAPERPPE